MKPILQAGLVLALAVSGTSVAAQGFFLSAGDVRLREDLSLLIDAGVIDLPANHWPLVRADVGHAVAEVDAGRAHDLALQLALARVVSKVTLRADAHEWRLHETSLSAGQPALLRDFGAPARDSGEFSLSGGRTTDRFNLRLSATAVLDANDGQHLRLDGSDVTLRLGNWLLGLNQMDRWWGPGHAGSLILSNNARPMPALSLDRMRSAPADLPVLRWLGPWRFSSFIGVMEDHRPDVDRPLYMAMRLSFKPSQVLEVAVSRAAMFCGKGRQCSLESFGRMLIGQDNIYLRGLEDPEDEPGNQLGGFEARMVSPMRSIPVALYGQMIGEDFSNSSVPIRYTYQVGAEGWWSTRSGSVFRAHVEHADTSSAIYKLWRKNDPRGREADTVYRHHIFFSGYRHRGRAIGHTTDSDSESTAVGLSLTGTDGSRWAARWQRVKLDRRGTADPYNSVTLGPSRYRSLQLSWQGRIRGQEIGMQLGYEEQSPRSAGDASGMFGLLRWRQAFD